MIDLIVTADGSHSLKHELLGELYHSDRGAIGESMHVFINNGLLFSILKCQCNLTILEVGFGTGLNAWLTLETAQKHNIKITYQTIELYPIDIQTAQQLNYTSDPLFMDLHTAQWGAATQITPNFSIIKHKVALESFDFTTLIITDLVYFDAFSPEVQPNLWSEAILKNIYDNMVENGIIVTYTAKGSVKQAMRAVGLDVVRLTGALGKRHMVRAIKSNK